MEADYDYFAMLHLPPGQYADVVIDRQYRSVRQEILSAGGPDRQRRLDDALIARSVLRSPARRTVLLKRYQASVKRRARHKPISLVTRRGGARAVRAGQPTSPAANAQYIPRSVVAPQAPAQAAGSDANARFAGMVLGILEGGLLRFTSRQRLMTAARGMGIGQFKANLIIAEVLHDVQAGRARPSEAPAPSPPPPAVTDRGISYGLRIAAAVLAALTANALLAWLIL